MHPAEIRAAALTLAEQGLNDCEIARRLGVPRPTVRDWRRPTYFARSAARCPRCWRRATELRFSAADYMELLGLYLGDGHITEMARCERLRISLDARYPDIVRETSELLCRCFPRNAVGSVMFHDGAVVLYLYSSHLSCLFPQHGPGKKHERRIVLESWQLELLNQAPWAFLRGCIRSDGCVFINRTGRYEYLSYGFANYSADILDCFEGTCRALGLRPRRYARAIRLNRREDVALLLQHVGRKS